MIKKKIKADAIITNQKRLPIAVLTADCVPLLLYDSKEEIIARVQRVKELSFLVRDPIESMPQAALRWVLDNSNISSSLTGAKTSGEVIDCTKASTYGEFTADEHIKAKLNHYVDFNPA